MTKINKGNLKSNSKIVHCYIRRKEGRYAYCVCYCRLIQIRLAQSFECKWASSRRFSFGNRCEQFNTFEAKVILRWLSPRRDECQNYHNAMLKSNPNTSMFAIEAFVEKTLFYFRTKKNFSTRMNAGKLQHRMRHMQHFPSNIQKYRWQVSFRY